MNNNYTCKICGYKDNNPFYAKELMLGLNKDFQYFECQACRCIQIVSIPDNIGDYYPSNYLSFGSVNLENNTIGIKRVLKSKLANYYLNNKRNIIGHFLSFVFKNPFPFLENTNITTDSKILDIGCGTGKLLIKMQNNGFNNLEGIDLFIESDYNYKNIKIKKQSLFQLTEKYDLIMLNHSFEHMEDPESVLKKLKDNLTENGLITIRIPVANSYAWRKYGVNWVQLDAPRHYYLHTTQSMSILCNRNDLTINSITFESSAFQFTESEKYLRGLSFNSTNEIFRKNELKEFQKKAIELNKINDGDSACFYITKQQKQ